ncbi:MAG: DNA polymerase III subunit gamma/tau [Acidimicrobiaceae bacterium]|jgi:DNA polymerase-3 subunit gamma/tau
MAESTPTPTSLDGVTSLYRRFRPNRFAELRGQDHVVRALQGAVKNDRVSHAYLFSGPRGTGKTTTARILAKALNCENPVDGDACDKCASCIAITRGSSLDVTELDAASNNGVDDIREITAGAWHGTPGRWKVYIFDEVHQLTKAAAAALLKTLEEPPSHVVFVLATTDPHKVLPTIRSRTQHLEFRLIGGDTLSSLLHDVEKAAGLKVDDSTIDAAVRLARGSARDALSALDQLIATGSVNDSQPAFEELFGALASNDAVAALKALAVLTREGWDPEQLAESFAAEVRQVFLLLAAPEVADVVDAERERLSAWGSQLGLARTVRILETLGKAMREMKSAPEKIVMLEIALVRLVKPELDSTVEALAERVEKLEYGVPRNAPVSAPAPLLRPIGSTTKAAPTKAAPVVAPEPVVEKVEKVAEEALELTLADVAERFTQRVIPRTARSAQLLLRDAQIVALDGYRLTVALPSEEMRANTEHIAQGLRSAMDHEFKTTFQIDWIVDANAAKAAPAPEPVVTKKKVEVAPDEYEPTGDAVVVDSVPGHLISEMFPGAEEIS